jgi:hypothetical protein
VVSEDISALSIEISMNWPSPVRFRASRPSRIAWTAFIAPE